MMATGYAVNGITAPGPGSPPGMTTSKSSKSSSFHSFSSDDHSVLSDVNHFEDIGLDDENGHRFHERDIEVRTISKRFSPTYSSDLRTASLQAKTQRLHSARDPSSKSRPQRDILPVPKTRPVLSSIQSHGRNFNNVRSTSTTSLFPDPLPIRSLSTRSPRSPSFPRRRSPSPGLTINSRDPSLVVRSRRGSWQSTSRDRKSALELEHECDEDDGDDIPDGLILDNVPISPRPPSERSPSQPSSKAASPERGPRDRVRSVGNGTPPVPLAHGSLRSPTWKTDGLPPRSPRSPLTSSEPPSPLKSRAKSWTAALSELNADAKDLTEKLEEHADELEVRSQRSSTGSMPLPRRSTDPAEGKQRHKSALAELPPLRRTNIMIDPLPISKEKEAVLSRTRPSWLPPKDPAEEKRHLREYQKMMAQSMEAERRREAAKKAQSECRDTAADSLQQIWEEQILPRWNAAVRERRTRDLWWRGIAPRSRGAVWSRAIGNELGLSETSYQAALGRAKDAEARSKQDNVSAEDAKHAAWFEAIRKDVEECTWRDLKIFQDGAPLHQGLVDVLSAYVMYRSDIGYVSGCNTIAALLLLNMPSPSAAFIALANVLNRALPLSFCIADPGAKASAYNLCLQTLAVKSPALHAHLTKLEDNDPEQYLGSVFTALFTRHLALDQVTRLWDVYVFEGDAVLVRAAVALLTQKEMVLLGTKSAEEVVEALEGADEGPDGRRRVVAQQGEEERWMRAVKEAGKA